jgi:signal peptidase I
LTKAKPSTLRSVGEIILVVAVAVGLALVVQAFLVKPYRIPSGSMEPTLDIGQRILVDRIGLRFSSPGVGDVVVFHPPADINTCADAREGELPDGTFAPAPCDVAQKQEGSVTFVKRVVGLPGDHLQIRDGHVIRNGKPEPSSFTTPCDGDPSCNFSKTIVVPKGDYYMMGDNRPDSDDSRFWGPVPRSWLIGTAFLTYWPPDRLGSL